MTGWRGICRAGTICTAGDFPLTSAGKFRIIIKLHPGVAQLVARLVRDQEAVGSNPATRTKKVTVFAYFLQKPQLFCYIHSADFSVSPVTTVCTTVASPLPDRRFPIRKAPFVQNGEGAACSPSGTMPGKTPLFHRKHTPAGASPAGVFHAPFFAAAISARTSRIMAASFSSHSAREWA